MRMFVVCGLRLLVCLCACGPGVLARACAGPRRAELRLCASQPQLQATGGRQAGQRVQRSTHASCCVLLWRSSHHVSGSRCQRTLSVARIRALRVCLYVRVRHGAAAPQHTPAACPATGRAGPLEGHRALAQPRRRQHSLAKPRDSGARDSGAHLSGQIVTLEVWGVMRASSCSPRSTPAIASAPRTCGEAEACWV